MHDVLVGHVGVREHDGVDLVLAHELLERRLRQDRNSLRIQRPGQFGRVAAPVDVRNLRGGKRDDVKLGTVAVHEVEVVKVPTGCSCDQDSPPRHV